MTTRISEVKLTSPLPSIDKLVEGVATGTTTATEAARLCLSRIDEEDATIHAYLSLDREGALARAAEIDAKAVAGEALPVLAGVPMGIKDVLVVEGSRRQRDRRFSRAIGLLSTQQPYADESTRAQCCWAS